MITLFDMSKKHFLAILMLLFAISIPSYSVGEESTFNPDSDLPTDGMELQGLEERVLHEPPSPDRCRCLAQDGKFLWVGTTNGAVRWDLTDNTPLLFTVDDDWSNEYVQVAGVTDEDRYNKRLSFDSKAYMPKWARNVVNRISVLAPGTIWAETYNGIMVIRGGRREIYASKERALAKLYETELKPSLARIVAVDKSGHLWRTCQIGEFYRSKWCIRRFDGRQWATMSQPAQEAGKPGSSIIQIVADPKGTLWACGWGGIYQWQGDRWEKVEVDKSEDRRRTEHYHELYCGPSGMLWAFGFGRLARFDGPNWKVFSGSGRTREFMLASSSLTPPHPYPAWETPDGKLWFEASELGLICFDDKTFRITSNVVWLTGRTIGVSGQMFISTGQRVFQYSDGKWKRISTPDKRGFKPSWPSTAETLYVYGLHLAENDTLYVATADGLLKYKGNKWEDMLFAEGKTGSEASSQQASTRQASVEQYPQDVISPDIIEQNYKAYVEGPGKQLVKATDDQLAEDIVKGAEPLSVMVSYHRLQVRNTSRAKECLEKRLGAILSRKPTGEFAAMELAIFGDPAIQPLLKLAKNGGSQERKMAAEALVFLQSKDAMCELLKLAIDPRTDGTTGVVMARSAVMLGIPEGVDFLIDTATGENGTEPSPKEGQEQKQTYARRILQEAVRMHDDQPANWSREVWRSWWKKHRATWKPDTTPSMPANMGSRMAQEIAKKLEAKTETKPAH